MYYKHFKASMLSEQCNIYWLKGNVTPDKNVQKEQKKKKIYEYGYLLVSYSTEHSLFSLCFLVWASSRSPAL